MVDWQCGVSFKCRAKWFSYTCYIYFQILSPYRILQNSEYSSLCYIVGPCGSSVLCLVVYIYVNPKLLFYHSPSFPSVTISLFSVSVNLFVLYISSFVSFCSPKFCVQMIPWHLSFSVWLTSIIVIICRSIYVAADGIISLLLFFKIDPRYSNNRLLAFLFKLLLYFSYNEWFLHLARNAFQ